MNHILDEEKIEKRIKDFYKTLLNRDADIEGLNYYTKLVQKNSLTMDEVYYKIQNSSEANKLKNTKIDNNEVIFKSKHTAEEIKKYFEENDTWYHSFNINGIKNKNTLDEANPNDNSIIEGRKNSTYGMPFYFKDLRDNRYIIFRAYIDGMTETISPSWATTNYVGRSEPVYVYEQAERSISFNLKIFAHTKKELGVIYKKMNKLT